MTSLLRPILLLSLLALLTLGLLGVVAREIYPAEDAAILFRYSEHLIDYGSISYNPGGEPVEGATDFLWMLTLAGGYGLGLSSFHASLWLSLLSLLGTLWLQYRLVQGDPWRLALLWLGWLWASQQWAAVQGFSVAFWGLSLWGCVWFWEKKHYGALYLAALVAALIRPDALVVVGPLCLGSLWLEPARRPQLLRQLLLRAGLPGLLYFAWRAWYFGEWLPLPFLVKGVASAEKVGPIDPVSLRYMLVLAVRYLGPLLLLVAWLGRKLPLPAQKRVGVLLLSFVLLPAAFYACITLEQNVANRFVLPLWVGSLTVVACYLPWGRLTKGLSSAFLLLSLLYFAIFFIRTLPLRHANIPSLAQDLAAIPSHRMAITEAGHLPYHSHWTALDLWGLNAPALATQVVGAEGLTDFAPHLINLHHEVGFDSLRRAAHLPYQTRRNWENMVMNTVKYAWQQGRYEAWLVPVMPYPATPDAWDRFHAWAIGLPDFLLRLRGQPQPPLPLRFAREDWYLLDRSAPAYQEIRTILQQHGGECVGELGERPALMRNE